MTRDARLFFLKKKGFFICQGDSDAIGLLFEVIVHRAKGVSQITIQNDFRNPLKKGNT